MRNSLMPIRLAVLALLALALASCGGGGGGTAVPAPTPTVLCTAPDPCVPLTVDNGPASYTKYNVNRLFTSVTICKSGTTQCQTIDHVLVDTGSTGLRLLPSPEVQALNLNSVTVGGNPLLNCVQFVDYSYAFGRVATADVVLGSKTALNLPIQVIADPAYPAPAPATCVLPGMTDIHTVDALGANGILGVGLYEQDCGPYCISIVNNDVYYTCPAGACTTTAPTTATAGEQVANPVPHFASDNNGVVIALPALPSAGAPSVIGQMLFGIGTHPSNTPDSTTTLFQTNPQGDINTVFQGITMTDSFIDSGSNGLFFGINTLPTGCSLAPDFYCPAVNTPFTATLYGTNAVAVSAPFVVGNANVLASTRYAALPTLAGPIGNNTSFDWGLPFFYGRRVFVGIEGRSSSVGTGPYYAF